jgi:hypothetical protein
LLLFEAWLLLGDTVLLAELVDAAGGVDDLLLAGVERDGRLEQTSTLQVFGQRWTAS